MYLNGFEFVHLRFCDVQLRLEHDEAAHIALPKGSGAAIVPRGVWHTLKLIAPAHMPHLNRRVDA